MKKKKIRKKRSPLFCYYTTILINHRNGVLENIQQAISRLNANIFFPKPYIQSQISHTHATFKYHTIYM